jgi:RNA polymerase sigma-70 factor (ECF subfamily)
MGDDPKELKKLSDLELVNLTLNSDKEYFSELVDRYHARLFRYLSRLMFSRLADAEECLGETFLKAYINLSTYSHRTSFSAWLYRIAHNQAIDHLRKHTAHQTIEIKEEDIVHDPSSTYMEENYLEFVLSKLNIEERNLLTLFYLEEMSLQEISDILKLKPNTISVKIKRAKEKIQKYNIF